MSGNEEFDEAMKLVVARARETEFKPYIHYNPDGDCLEVVVRPDSYCGNTLPNGITLYRNDETEEIIGFFIPGVSRMEKMGVEFLKREED